MSESKGLTNELLKSKMTDAVVHRGICSNIDTIRQTGYFVTNNTTEGTFPSGFAKEGVLVLFMRTHSEAYYLYMDISGNLALRMNSYAWKIKT